MTAKYAALALTVAACGTSVADPPKRTEPSVTRLHMHQNFDLVRAIERLLIRGELEPARRFAAAISSAPDEPEHGPWATYTVAVRERADAVARSTTVHDAIRKTTALAAACGNCHGDLGVSPRFATLPKVPADRPGIEARMLRHRWAADRLWEGVIGNSDVAWKKGLDVLAAAPLDEPADRAKLARELQRLAAEARRPSAGPMVDRPTKYGEILIVCATCHQPATAR